MGSSSKPVVTESDMLEALREVLNNPPTHDVGDGQTVEELCVLFKITNPKRVRDRLRVLIAAGKVECVMGKRRRIDGQNQTVPTYRAVGSKRPRRKR